MQDLLIKDEIAQHQNHAEQNRKRIGTHEAILDLAHYFREPLCKSCQPVCKGIDALLIGIFIQTNFTDPVIGPGDDRLMHKVMPEAPVDHIRKEGSNFLIWINDDRKINFIHEPFVFHAREEEAERLLQWI